MTDSVFSRVGRAPYCGGEFCSVFVNLVERGRG